MNWNNYDLITMVEEIASGNSWIASEWELSERFDEMLKECYPNIDTDDETMVNEMFNDWTDGLCKDGEIHPEQYNTYEYVGKWS
jgi:hypothetical protein